MADEHTTSVADRLSEMPVIGVCARCPNELRPWWTMYSNLGARRICYQCQLAASRARYFRRVGKPVPPKQTTRRAVPAREALPATSLCVDCMSLFERHKGMWRFRCQECSTRRRIARRGAAYAKRVEAITKGNKSITWQAVGERDQWICHLCEQPVERRTHHADPWVATVDHVVPLVRGGAHEWDNVRLAHRRCNCSRGARPMENLNGRR